MQNFKKAVLEAVEAYNHFRSPEATVKLVKIEKDRMIMDFEGSFCTSCGVYDYLEDFVYELQNFIGVDMKILHFDNYGSEKIRVEYKVKLAVGQE